MPAIGTLLRTSAVVLLAACGGGTASDRPGDAGSVPAGDSALAVVVEAGEEMYWRGEYDSARVAWRTALVQAESSGDIAAEPRILTWLGLAAWRQGEYAEARTLGEQALELKHERGLGAELARSYNALGLLAWNEGRLSDAALLFRRSAESARAQADETGIARAAGNLGLVHTELADYDSARDYFELARTSGRRLGDARIEANALANLAMLDIRLGDPRSVMGYLAEARHAYREIGYEMGEQNALGQLGTLYAAIGEPSRAFAALDSALELSRRQGLRQEEAAYLELIGNLYASMGDSHRALRFYGEALLIARELGLVLQAGTIRRSEGAVLARLGNLDRARQAAEDGVGAHRAAGARLEEQDDLLLLAEVSALAGRTVDAAAHIARAHRIAREIGSGAAQMSAAVTEARIEDRARRPEAVLRALRWLGTELATADVALLWEVYALRARAFAATAQGDSAVAAGKAAIAAVERIRQNVPAGPLRTAFVAERSQVYADLAINLLRLGRVVEAFEVADAARGRALLEHLSAAREEAATAAVRELAAADQLLRRIDALVARVAEMEQEPDSERGHAATKRAVAERLAEARSEYETLLLRIAQRHPAATAMLSARRIEANEVLAALHPNELLVQYLVTPDRLLFFAVTTGGVHPLQTELSSRELTNRIRLARDLVSHPQSDTGAITSVSTALHAVLIGPLRDAGLLDGVRRLVIVPHEALTYLPFAALLDGDTGRYLADDFAIVLLPSAGALPLLRGTAASTLPETPAGKASGFAPFPNRLPATRRELKEFRRAVSGAAVLTGTRATEAAVRQALERGAVVHIATHGVMNARNPMFSRIELARGRGTEPRNDGRLEVHELLGFTIRSPLVFLSGCETGLGVGWATDFAPGEDYTTLAQTFLYAGARNVIATLWRIHDDGAAVFAAAFYGHLRTSSPAAALAAAQRETRRHPAFAHPYYWAGYALSGGDVPFPLSRSLVGRAGTRSDQRRIGARANHATFFSHRQELPHATP